MYFSAPIAPDAGDALLAVTYIMAWYGTVRTAEGFQFQVLYRLMPYVIVTENHLRFVTGRYIACLGFFTL